MKKTFIGTVGYHNLRNHSIGPALLPQLQKMQWPEGVDVDELNWGGPMHSLHKRKFLLQHLVVLILLYNL